MNEELCSTIVDMAEAAIQASTMVMIQDDIHKIGLVETLKAIIVLIEENK